MSSCNWLVCCEWRSSRLKWKSLCWERRACWKRSERACRSVRCSECRSVCEVRRADRSDWRVLVRVWRAVSWEVRLHNESD